MPTVLPVPANTTPSVRTRQRACAFVELRDSANGLAWQTRGTRVALLFFSLCRVWELGKRASKAKLGDTCRLPVRRPLPRVGTRQRVGTRRTEWTHVALLRVDICRASDLGKGSGHGELSGHVTPSCATAFAECPVEELGKSGCHVTSVVSVRRPSSHFIETSTHV